MKFKNIDNWKTEIKKRAAEKNIKPTDMQQRYILEEFASKISHSQYKDSMILKGGFIVSNLLGIDNRTTRDIDLTFNSTIYSEDEIRTILTDVASVCDDSFFDYEIHSVKECQVDDGYSGFSATIHAISGKTKLPLKLDISNNTLVYPQAIENRFQSMFFEDNIQVMSYSIENIIAEKFETTLDRGEFNTRMRDLFDIALLMETQTHLIDDILLADCIIEVSKERGTLSNLFNFNEIVLDLQESEIFNKNFDSYKKKRYPNSSLVLRDVFDVFNQIQDYVELYLGMDEKTPFNEQISRAKEKQLKNPSPKSSKSRKKKENGKEIASPGKEYDTGR